MKKKLLSLLLLVIPYVTFAQEKGLDERINEWFTPIADWFVGFSIIPNKIFFLVWTDPNIPFVLLLLVGSAAFFTLYFKFPNIRHFWTAISVVRGKYDHVDHPEVETAYGDVTPGGDAIETIRDESEDGEVSHFQALATAVSGTVGNGNIAGVALAIALGGPGATFWMIVCGLLGMSTKFVECTLGVQYRDVDENGVVYGGPMYYISKGLKERGFAMFGKIAAVFFAIFCIGGSFGGGNAAQSNQATIVVKELLGLESTSAGAIIGLIIAIIVGIIIIGGIKRIASVTEKVVPFMAVLYIVACLYIIFSNLSLVDDAFGLIFREAFNPTAIGVGSIIGVLLVGFQRAAFSNEAGAGSASIAHSAVKTKYSASEGLVALLEPFIDTVVICTMTALVIIIFNAGGVFDYGGLAGAIEQADGTFNAIVDGITYENVKGKVLINGELKEGAGITASAFAQYIPYSNVFLTIAVFLFAISTMISWSYYGLQSWKFLFGRGKTADLVYKAIVLQLYYHRSSREYEFYLGLFRCNDLRDGLPKYDRFIFLISSC